MSKQRRAKKKTGTLKAIKENESTDSSDIVSSDDASEENSADLLKLFNLNFWKMTILFVQIFCFI